MSETLRERLLYLVAQVDGCRAPERMRGALLEAAGLAEYAEQLNEALVRAHDTMLMLNSSDLGRSDRETLEAARVHANAALAKNPNPAGVGRDVESVAERHEPGSGNSASKEPACTVDRESGASHQAGEGCVHEICTHPSVNQCGERQECADCHASRFLVGDAEWGDWLPPRTRTQSGTKRKLVGWLDTFNQEFVHTLEDAQRRSEGGNTLKALYTIEDGEVLQVRTKREDASYSCWLIERRGIELCIGMCGDKFKWVSFIDPMALQFARKEDAQAVMRLLPEASRADAEPRDHMFCCGATP